MEALPGGASQLISLLCIGCLVRDPGGHLSSCCGLDVGCGPHGAGGWSVPSTGEKTQARAPCSVQMLSLRSSHPTGGEV